MSSPTTADPVPPPATASVPHHLDLPHVEGVSHGSVLVDGFRLHYAEAGTGQPVILLHGWPQNWWEWRHVIGPLAERHRVICPDIRGLGWSEGPGTGAAMEDYSFSRLATDLIELLDALQVEAAALVGHDWGSAVGYRACLSFPHRFRRAVMMGGVHPWSAFANPRLYLRPWHVWGYAVFGAPLTTRFDVPAHCLRTWRYAGEFTQPEIEAYLERIRRPAAIGATRAYDRNLALNEIPWFWRHHRALRLRVPTLHLNGAEDPLTRGVPRHSWRPYADDMRFELVPECGHFLAEERPAELVARLTSFLDA